MTIRCRSFHPLLALSLTVLTACDKKEPTPPPESHPSADAGTAVAPGVDKNIAEAVGAVVNGAAQEQGPPPTGVLAPGAADKEMKVGDMPKLSLGNKGTGPTVQFAVPARAGKKLEGKVEIGVQTGPRSALPTMDIVVTFEPGAAKPEPESTSPVAVSGKVTSATLAADQPGELPPGLDKQVAKAKGSHLVFEFGSNGAGRPVGMDVSKDLDPSFSQVLASSSNALSVAFSPYPNEPVGVGAFWMVTSRELFAGIDVIVYRMMKLESVDAGRALVSVSAKRFMAGGQLGFAGLPPSHVVEFSGNSTGKLDVSPSNPNDLRGEMSDVLLAALVPDGALPPGAAPGQKMQVHVEIHSRVALGH